MIDIEEYLVDKMGEKFSKESMRFLEDPEDYEETVENMFLETIWQAEQESEDVKQFKQAYIDKFGNDEGMWYDEFWKNMILYGDELAEEYLVSDYLKNNQKLENGKYTIELSEKPDGFHDDENDVTIEVSYDPGVNVCFAHVKSNGTGKEYFCDLKRIFTDYFDFVNSI